MQGSATTTKQINMCSAENDTTTQQIDEFYARKRYNQQTNQYVLYTEALQPPNRLMGSMQGSATTTKQINMFYAQKRYNHPTN